MKTIDKDVSNNDDDVNHKIDNENEYYNHDISIVEAEDEEKQLNETNIKNCTENNDDNDDDYDEVEGIRFVNYVDESQLDYVMSLVGRDLSEPYSIFTYRYFLHRFPNLCILAIPTDSETNEPIGCVVGKIDYENDEDPDSGITESSPNNTNDSNNESSESFVGEQTATTANYNDNGIYDKSNNNHSNHNSNAVGYIGMLAVSKEYRRRGIGKALVQRILSRMMVSYRCTSVTLETEVTNTTAQKLYQDIFGFIREELLVRYYLNWNDAYRLRLWFS